MLLIGRCGPLLCPLIVPPGPLVMVQSHFFANKTGGISYTQPITGKSQPQSIRLKLSAAEHSAPDSNTLSNKSSFKKCSTNLSIS